MLSLILIGTIFIISYIYLKKTNSYWKNRGVAQGNPKLLFGNYRDVFLGLRPLCECAKDVYKSGAGKRYVGNYRMMKPTLFIRDPELIKQISIKDFEYFTDRTQFVPDDTDKLWSKNLVVLRGQKWKDMRSTLSPSFTSSKMKSMFVTMRECAENFTGFFVNQKESVIEVELKDIFMRYTNDVIASVAFGVKCDSLREPKNEFYTRGTEINFESFWRSTIALLLHLIPSVLSFLGIGFFSKNLTSFFRKTMKEAIKNRENGTVYRQDMLQLLIEARKNGKFSEDEVVDVDTGFATVQESSIGLQSKKIELTDDDITSQALVFFFGGFENISVVMSFMGYELGVHPEVQKKLQDEIDDSLKKCGGKITYEGLLNMKYLDMVVSEILRKWTPFSGLDRVVTKPYTINPVSPDELPVKLKVGDIVTFPLVSIHHDAKYFPNPDKFDPERFSDENKSKINPFTYFPFGLGPRNCIASRFSILEVKILMFELLSKFSIVPVEKSEIPVVLMNKMGMGAKNGFWFGFKKRF